MWEITYDVHYEIGLSLNRELWLRTLEISLDQCVPELD